MDQKVSPKILLDQSIDEKVSPKLSLDRKCHQKLCDLRNRESDQNLSVIKVAGNQKIIIIYGLPINKSSTVAEKIGLEVFLWIYSKSEKITSGAVYIEPLVLQA